MTKTKRQLRAEAVERLKEKYDPIFDAAGCKATAQMPYHELIGLLTDDEPYISNLVIDGEDYIVIPAHYVTESTTEIKIGEKRFVLATDEPPEGDALEIMYVVANQSDGHTLYHGITKLMQAISKEPEDRRETGTELAIALRTLASMVERDYVRRDVYEHNHGLWESDLWRMTDKRDELHDKVDKLEAERDEWKAKADCFHDYEEGVADGNPFIKAWTCRKCGHKMLIEPAELRGSGNDGVERSMTNLEWLVLESTYGGECAMAMYNRLFRLPGKPWNSNAEFREWLMAEHVDQSHVSSLNGTCSDSMG